MRNFTRSAAVMIVVLSASGASADDDVRVTATASATPKPGTIEAGLYVGGFVSNSRHQFFNDKVMPNPEQLDKLSPEFGLRFAIFPWRVIGLEFDGSMITTNTKDSGQGAKILTGRTQLIVQRPGRITPFLDVGIGIYATRSPDNVLGNDTDFPIHVGGGIRFFATKVVALRLDGQLIRGPSKEDPYTLNASYGEFTLGLSFNPIPAKNPRVLDLDPDKDGVIGEADACPNEAGPKPDGCPTRDKDGDGIPDAVDKCPSEPETVNGFQDSDGCPDTVPDSDGDGIDDLKDKCKDEPEDKDGFQDEDGCPDPDNDGDGVLDGVDKCPLESGPPDNAGCPKPREVLKIVDQPLFKTNSAALDKAATKQLDNVVSYLKAHPDIVKIRVEGHADDVGDDVYNLKLSQSRAESVVKYLNKAGIDASRLEATGFGSTKPLVEGKTVKARSANRRVEFVVVSP